MEKSELTVVGYNVFGQPILNLDRNFINYIESVLPKFLESYRKDKITINRSW